MFLKKAAWVSVTVMMAVSGFAGASFAFSFASDGRQSAVTLEEAAQFYFRNGWAKGSDSLGEYAEGILNDDGQPNGQVVMFLEGSDVALNAYDLFRFGTKARIYVSAFHDGSWVNCGRYALAADVGEDAGAVQFESQAAWIVPQGIDPILRHLSTGKTEIVHPGERVNKGDILSYFASAAPHSAAPATVEEMLSLLDPFMGIEWDGVDTAAGYMKNPFTRPLPRLIAVRNGETVAVGMSEKIGFDPVTLRHYDGAVREVEGNYFRENYDKFAREVIKEGGWTILKDIHTPFKVEHGWAMVFAYGTDKRLKPGTVVEEGASVIYAIPNVDGVPYGALPPAR